MITREERRAYLNYAQKLTPGEINLISIFAEWLPENLIDCHTHCSLEKHVNSIHPRAFQHMLSTFPYFSLEESAEWNTVLHPQNRVRTLRFAMPYIGIDFKKANSYLLTSSPLEDRIALFGIPHDPEYTNSMLDHPRVSALKMYHMTIEPPAKKIFEYFPREILREAEKKQIPIILHPPTRITKCVDQIIQLTKLFPDLKICLAHISLTKEIVPGLSKTLEVLKKIPNIWFDTALVPCHEVVFLALRIIGPNRIMYGSDSPLHLIRSKPYSNPMLGERLITEIEYHWVDKKEHLKYKHLANNPTHAHWDALIAIKKAIERLPLENQASTKNKIFHDNAAKFYNF